MPTASLAARVGGLLTAAALATGITACAAEPPLGITAPTMAPDQSIAEACAISGEEVDRITREAESQIRQGIEQAGSDLASGKTPSFEFLSESIDQTVAEVEQQITNSEVLAALGEVRTALQGFGEIAPPDSLLGAPGYIASLGGQLSELSTAGRELQQLCTEEGAG